MWALTDACAKFFHGQGFKLAQLDG